MSKLYHEAATVVKDVRAHRRGISSFKFSSPAVYALACETLRFAEVLKVERVSCLQRYAFNALLHKGTPGACRSARRGREPLSCADV